MKILISLAGLEVSSKTVKSLADDSDFIIAADGGYLPLEKNNIQPNLIIGDFDSVSIENFSSSIEVIRHPREKDKSDGELAVELALMKNPRTIVLTNALGLRPDQYLANLILTINHPGLVEIVDDNWIIKALTGPVDCYLQKLDSGKLISIFAWGKEITGLSLTGCKYSVNEINLYPGTRGLSNVIESSEIRISFQSGTALLFTEY
ncbi:MAG: thiamine diphosphokinase [bacterium]